MKWVTRRKPLTEIEKKYQDTFGETCKQLLRGAVAIGNPILLAGLAAGAVYGIIGSTAKALLTPGPLDFGTLESIFLEGMGTSLKHGLAVSAILYLPLLAYGMKKFGMDASITGVKFGMTKRAAEALLWRYLLEEPDESPEAHSLGRGALATCINNTSGKRFPLIVYQALEHTYDAEQQLFKDGGRVLVSSLELLENQEKLLETARHKWLFKEVTPDFIQGWFNTIKSGAYPDDRDGIKDFKAVLMGMNQAKPHTLWSVDPEVWSQCLHTLYDKETKKIPANKDSYATSTESLSREGRVLDRVFELCCMVEFDHSIYKNGEELSSLVDFTKGLIERRDFIREEIERHRIVTSLKVACPTLQ